MKDFRVKVDSQFGKPDEEPKYQQKEVNNTGNTNDSAFWM